MQITVALTIILVTVYNIEHMESYLTKACHQMKNGYTLLRQRRHFHHVPIQGRIR